MYLVKSCVPRAISFISSKIKMCTHFLGVQIRMNFLITKVEKLSIQPQNGRSTLVFRLFACSKYNYRNRKKASEIISGTFETKLFHSLSWFLHKSKRQWNFEIKITQYGVQSKQFFKFLFTSICE